MRTPLLAPSSAEAEAADADEMAGIDDAEGAVTGPRHLEAKGAAVAALSSTTPTSATSPLELNDSIIHQRGSGISRRRPKGGRVSFATSTGTGTTANGYSSSSHSTNGDGAGTSPPPPPPRRHSRDRILDRDGRFRQAKGKWNVHHANHHLNRWNRARFYFDDWFHSLLYSPTHRVFLLLFFLYTLTVITFGGVYYGVSRFAAYMGRARGNEGFCNMDIANVMEAMYFSLSTMTTIGYGVSDYYFGDCWAPFILVLAQVFAAITFDAVAIGLLFQRLSRGRKRGRTVVFSDRAVVRRVRGVPYLMFRLGELVKRHLVECHVRAYCVRHDRTRCSSSSASPSPDYRGADGGGDGDGGGANEQGANVETTYFQVYNLRLIHPNDELGSYLLMTLPSVIVHRMDESSPLVPPARGWYDEGGRFHEPVSRPNDEGGDDGDGGSDDDDERRRRGHRVEEEETRKFWNDREAEIVVLVEGVDEMTGSVLQAKHSYRCASVAADDDGFAGERCEEEVSWNVTFAPCVSRGGGASGSVASDVGAEGGRQGRRGWFRSGGSGGGGGVTSSLAHGKHCVVDFSKFHDLLPAPLDCDSCPFVTLP